MKRPPGFVVPLVAALLLAACTPSNPSNPSSESPTVGSTLRPHTQLPTPNTGHTTPQPQNLFTAKTSPDRELIPADPTVKPTGFVDPPPGSGLDRYFNQPVVWNPCDSRYECSKVSAPLDWSTPDGQAITLAIRRLPASQGPRLGSLFINPGGPGMPAQDFVRGFNNEGLMQYDIIGVDPRGSGESTPVKCGTDEQTDAYNNLDWSPDDGAETQALIEGIKAFAAQCRAGSGVLLEHISSQEAVYDFDLVRELLGEQKFNFLGVSYGTRLGSLYAELFGDKVGRMVLDSAVNITDQDNVAQTDGFELSLHNYAKWCVSGSKCPLGTTEDQVVGRVSSLLNQLDEAPKDVGDRLLTQSLAEAGLAFFFYGGQTNYNLITQVLQWTLSSNNGQYLLDGADVLNDRGKDRHYGPLAYAFPAISCLDAADKGLLEAFSTWKVDAQKAPVFGTYAGPNALCTLWSVKPAAQVKITAPDAPEILVLGSTGDPATPYSYAESMSKQLTRAVLVTRDGAGHGAYNAGSKCVDDAVRGYLAQGTVPSAGLICSA